MNNPLEEPNTLEEIINDICEEELCKVHISKAEALAQIERDWVKKSEVLAAIIQTVSLTSSYQQGDHWIDANELKDRLNLEK